MIKKSDIRRGTEISCYINNKSVDRAKIQVQDGYVFICQNKCSGDRCLDKLGFESSWSVGDLSMAEEGQLDQFFYRTGVTRVNLISVPEWDEEKNHIYS